MKSFSEISNSDMLDMMQSYRYPSETKGWGIDINTGEFLILISNMEISNAKIDHIKNCDFVSVELYDYREPPKPEELAMPDLYMPDGTKIKFEVSCFPHIRIYPNQDTRFKNQPWANNCYFTTNELCDIVRYCVKLPGLKAFL